MLAAAEDDVQSQAAQDLGSLDGLVWIRINTKDTWEFYVEMPVADNSMNVPYAAARLEFYRDVPSSSAECQLNGKCSPSVRASISDFPNCERSFQLARSWVFQCLHHHKQCARSQHVPLPPRVIDVGSSDGVRKPRLVDGAGKKGSYLTLSHVWGSNRRGLTLTTNLSERQSTLLPSTLPKTFRDAIVITRNLGYQYVWIDSLCIVQDSVEDWKANCKEMSTIYGKSSLTIASLWAKDSSDGIFCDRKHMYPHNKFKTGRVPADLVIGQPATYVRVAQWNLRTAISSSTLNKRGWVLQERIFSPAILYYWLSEMFWECNGYTAAESQPRPLITSGGLMKNIFQEMQREGTVAHEQGHLTAWYLLVEQYTQRDLTVPSDRLPAIMGLARRFGITYSVNYVKGLWIEDLHRGLLWVRRWESYEPTCQHGPSSTPLAPSWSWVSVQAPVAFAWQIGWGYSFHYPIRRLPTSFDADVVDVTNHQGLLRSQPYRLKGYVQMWVNMAVASYMTIQASDPPRKTCPWQNPGYCVSRKRKDVDSCKVRCALDCACHTVEKVYCAKISTWEHDLGAKEFRGLLSYHKPIFTYFLVLQRVHAKPTLLHPLDRGMFRRIGIGADEATVVEPLFKSSTRCFLTLM